MPKGKINFKNTAKAKLAAEISDVEILSAVDLGGVVKAEISYKTAQQLFDMGGYYETVQEPTKQSKDTTPKA